MKYSKIYIRWLYLVGINVIVSLFFAFTFLSNHAPISNFFALSAGIITIIILCAKIDIYLIETKRKLLQSAVYTAVIIKALIQVVVLVDFYIGSIAILTTNYIEQHFMFFINKSDFLLVYFLVFINGLLALVMVSLITPFIYYILLFLKSNKYNKR